MHEGWILSEGTVVASAVADRRWQCGASMARSSSRRGICIVGAPWMVVLGPGSSDRVDLCLLDAVGQITRSRSLAGHHVALVGGGRTVVVAPAGVLEASGIGPGSVLEFREAA